ncbi:MAG: sulfite reductase subunit C [Planctomycetes bacterium]|nr:sulfite reductase subunit C [Planctomycetota bacterium]
MYHVSKVVRNAFRITKTRGETAARLRVPGGHLAARHLAAVQQIAEQFGNGTVHLTTRQGFEIPGIKLSDMDRVKRRMADMIQEIEQRCGTILEDPLQGYPASGTRNVVACIGNRVCQFANSDTTRLAQKLEAVVYPSHYHLKIAVTGCPNDCIKAHLHDIGVISTVVPEYDEERCIACEACVENCAQRVTGALRIENCRVSRDAARCILCGECTLKCPAGAQARGKQLYRLIVGGRTGKKNPRLANTFIEHASEEVVLGVCRNVYAFIHYHIDTSRPKEHLGYIIDRAGFEAFARDAFEGLALNPEARVASRLHNPGYSYP